MRRIKRDKSREINFREEKNPKESWEGKTAEV